MVSDAGRPGKRRFDRWFLLGERRNELLALGEVQQYGRDSFGDPDVGLIGCLSAVRPPPARSPARRRPYPFRGTARQRTMRAASWASGCFAIFPTGLLAAAAGASDMEPAVLPGRWAGLRRRRRPGRRSRLWPGASATTI